MPRQYVQHIVQYSIMPRSISISEARARLPELAKYLRRSPRQVVFIEHRDMKERLALVTESRLRYLEALVAAAAQQGASSFKLAGSVTSELSDEELARALTSIKEDHLARSDAKAEEL